MQRQVTTRFKKNALAKFNPRKTKIKLGGIKAAIQQAAKLGDPAFFHEAVDAYVAEQAEFVAWWKAHVTPAQGTGLNPVVAKRATTGIPAADATTQTGITKWQVSRWGSAIDEDRE